METKKFLNSEFAPHHKPVLLNHPPHLRQEYRLRRTVFAGVLSSQMYLATRARAMYETWGSDVSMLVFFVGEDCVVPPELSHLPVIKLSGVPDAVYPPLKKAFAVMQYMYDHYVDDYDWFIRADDDLYLRGRKLADLLHTMDAGDMISLGRAGVGRSNDMDRLKLLKHERYCMGGPGMIFSRGLMAALGPYLNLCLQALLYHDRKEPDFPWNDDDVEIGRCISRELDVQCSTSLEGRQYFYTDYVGESLDTKTLWTKPEFRDVITIHPIKDPDHVRSLHLFYQTLDFEEVFLRKQILERSLSSVCRDLPPNLVPPSFRETECAVEFATNHVYDRNSGPVRRQVHHHHQKV
jgi:chondroitin sulfate synthase